MNAMIERAARALCLSSSEDGPEHVDIAMELDGDDWRDLAQDTLLAALDPADEDVINAVESIEHARIITRRNKAHDESQWEVVHDIDPSGPISDDSYVVIGRFESERLAESFAQHAASSLNARARISALRALAAQGEPG